jgi:hypothetical protein
MSISPLALWISGGVLLLIIAIALFIVRWRLQKKGSLSHSLGLGLLKIQLPKPERQDNEKVTINDVREKVALMEQVYSQLATIREGGLHSWLYGKPFFSLEIAVPHVGQ